MKVFILNLLAVSSSILSAYSHAIPGYSHHGQLLSYKPARGEFPVYNNLAQGYVRYFDNNGAERLVGYNYPEPLYGVRRYSYTDQLSSNNQGNQLLRTTYGGGPGIGPAESGFSAETYYQIQETNELAKAREEHFRRWCEQRYQALKAEMDKLRAEGFKPSSDMMAQLKPLEKIISSTNYMAIGGDGQGSSPEIQRMREEHLRIWNEARLKVLQQEANHLRFSQGTFKDTKTYPVSGSEQMNINFNAVTGETAEQKRAREEHLRIYNEQLANLKKIENEQKREREQETNSFGAAFTLNEAQKKTDFAFKSGFQQQQAATQKQWQPQPQQTSISETPEVIKAREEHLRIYNEQLAKLKRLEAEKSRFHLTGSQSQGQQQSIELKNAAQNIQLDVIMGETAEQKKAREEHLRLYNEQLAKVQQLTAEQKLQQGIWGGSNANKEAQTTYGTYQEVPSLALKSSFQEIAQSQPQQTATTVGDTPEVIRAREEHLRLYNEQLAKVQQSEAEQKMQQGIWGVSNANKQAQNTYGTYQEVPSLSLKSSFQEFVQPQLKQTATRVGDTPEVIKAREEHLRLVNEAKLRVQAEGNYNSNDDGSYKAEYQAGSSYKTAEQKTDQGSILRIYPAVQQPIQPIQNIAIVQTAQPTNQGIQQQQQSSLLKTTATTELQQQPQPQQPAPVQDTPEVIKAREEHLRIVNEIKSKAEQSEQEMKQFEIRFDGLQQQQQSSDKAQTYTSIDSMEEERLREEKRLMEMERLREFERMREEEKMREMERLRELERRKEEEKMLEDERQRLKQEEEKRMEMERMEEAKRLSVEQEKIITKGGQTTSSISSGISSDLLGSQLKKTQDGLLFKSQQQVLESGVGESTGYIAGASSTGGLVTGATAAADTGSGFVLSSQYKNNPYLIRFASQPGTTAYIIGEQQQGAAAAVLQNDAARPNLLYLPAAQKESGPLYLRYTQGGLQSPNAVQQLATASLAGGSSADKFSTYSSSSSSSSGSASASGSLSNLKVSYGAATEKNTDLSELEKATRDHFRAHELALEQLRLANAKTPFKKDC